MIGKEGIQIEDEGGPSRSTKAKTILRLFKKLSMTQGWSNGRDIKTLAGTIAMHVYGSAEGIEKRSSGKLAISLEILNGFLKDMLRSRIRAVAV